MSAANNQALIESRGSHTCSPTSHEATQQSCDRRAASYDALLVERRLRSDREDVTWSAVLGYN
jgi:hypothetical protein